MVASDLVRFGTQGIAAGLLITHHARLWHLIVLMAIYGTGAAFFLPAQTGLVPHTVSGGAAPGGERAPQPHLERVLGARPVGERRAGGDGGPGLGARRRLRHLPRQRRLPRGARARDSDSAGAAAAVPRRARRRLAGGAKPDVGLGRRPLLCARERDHPRPLLRARPGGREALAARARVVGGDRRRLRSRLRPRELRRAAAQASSAASRRLDGAPRLRAPLRAARRADVDGGGRGGGLPRRALARPSRTRSSRRRSSSTFRRPPSRARRPSSGSWRSRFSPSGSRSPAPCLGRSASARRSSPARSGR